jgi:peptidoglycan hydrolase CwlO-like protein|tara:strand:+ start:97 stop:477 length:381 start_codon:yes stop_codon:yes gene_type:complete
LKKILNNIQLVFIVILAVALILSLLFRPSIPIDTYEDEINALKTQNKQLLLSNDSINNINNKLQEEINTILYAIDSTKVVLKETETKLAELEKKRNEIPNIINNMASDDITSNISDYLKRRSKGDN